MSNKIRQITRPDMVINDAGPILSPEQSAMYISLREKIFGMYIGCQLVRQTVFDRDAWVLDIIYAEAVSNYAKNIQTKPALTRLRDITPAHEDIFCDFAQALQTVETINSNEDIERAVTAFSMAANRLRDLGYDCDGLIDAGLAIDLKLVTVN